MSEFLYGYQSNGQVCKCGRHPGVGEWSPERRAAVYKRMSEKMPSYLNPDAAAYLASWEEHHGIVHYRMEVIGKSDGKSGYTKKGKDILCPVFIDPNAVPENDLFTPPQRADIHG